MGILRTACLIGVLWAHASDLGAQILQAPFSDQYTLQDLGAVPGVPTPYGGLILDPNDPEFLLIGGAANGGSASIYRIQLSRDLAGHVNGFIGNAVEFARANGNSGGIDGGLQVAPNGVLLYTSFSDNHLGQLRPGSFHPDKLINLSALSPVAVSSSVGTLAVVPNGFAGAGRIKIASFSTSEFYDAQLVPDGNGTFDIVGLNRVTNIGGGPEGLVYVQAGNPLIDQPSLIVSEYSSDRIVVYELDQNSNPLVNSRRTILSGLSGALGATLDPISGDFMFSTFGGSDRVIVIRGFQPPPLELGVDAFHCYRAAFQRGPRRSVQIDDGYSSGLFRLGGSRKLCTPASIDGSAVGNRQSWLQSFDLWPGRNRWRGSADLLIDNLVHAGAEVRISGAPALLSPAVDGNATVSGVMTSFACYRAYTRPMRGVSLAVDDQFAVGLNLRLGRLRSVCVPASVDGVPSPQSDVGLACYRSNAKPPDGRNGVVSSDFGSRHYRLKAPGDLCLPSLLR